MPPSPLTCGFAQRLTHPCTRMHATHPLITAQEEERLLKNLVDKTNAQQSGQQEQAPSSTAADKAAQRQEHPIPEENLQAETKSKQ